MILKYSTLQYFIMPETEPDEWDIRMLEEAKSDPECSIFTKEEEIDWNTPGNEAKK